jgi:CubicO group peptidase (beta-lactamase class C family)
MKAAIDTICREAIAAKVFPGCQIGWLEDDKIVVQSYGRLRYEPDSAVVTGDTLYDVASVTKSIPTNSLLLKLIEQGRLGLDDPVTDYLPELTAVGRESLRIRHLVTYTAVFDVPGGLAKVALADPDHLLRNIFTFPLAYPPGEHFAYTNLPAILIGLIINKVTGRPLDRVAAEEFFDPLGMHQTFFKPPMDSHAVAPTERHGDRDIIGMPHDEAARVMRSYGVIAGNAGVFSTAGDMLRFMRMLLAGGAWDGRTYFEPKTVKAMHTNQIGPIGGQVGLGWEMSRALLDTDKEGIFGKTGFTGCAVVMDADAGRGFVILSNRNYPQRTDRGGIRGVRAALAGVLLADR